MNIKPLILICLFFSGSVFAHGGATNSKGCHNNNSTGKYHCHNSNKPSNNEYSSRYYPKSKYNRKDWPHWLDTDRDCQNTRAEILIRDSDTPVKFKRNRGCSVSLGKWVDPYTLNVYFRASDVDIDHLVPLFVANAFGGDKWSKEKKAIFANDPENLLAVEDNANQEKGAQGPQHWMPENKAYHCTYISKWVYIKQKYGLRYSKREKAKIKSVLSKCPKSA